MYDLRLPRFYSIDLETQAFLGGKDCSQLGSISPSIVPLTRIGTAEVSYIKRLTYIYVC